MSGGVGIWSKADSQPSVEGLWVETKNERAGG